MAFIGSRQQEQQQQQQELGMGEDDETKMPDASNLLDRAQALHTALGYLCSINADIVHVEDFLFRHSEALLLEGTGDDSDENVASILTKQESNCQCSTRSACRRNRRAIQRLLHEGFSYMQSQNMNVHLNDDWSKYEDKLIEYEKDIHQLRQQEFTIRQFALEAAVHIQKFQEELKLAEQYYLYKPKFSIFACGKHHDEILARRSVLDYQIDSAHVELTSLERLHEAATTKIKRTRRLQYGILKQALPCSVQHTCKKAPPEPNMDDCWSFRPVSSDDEAPSVGPEEFSI
ncbi:hypothetical protein MPSEU_001101200 [Mayamaea pseudoterrestris]|nr:hypothetical protein MPSEU_001101200 [Mayamaea pseudoterrestris]